MKISLPSTRTVGLVLFGALCATAGGAWASYRDDEQDDDKDAASEGHHSARREFVRNTLRELDLTDPQKDQLKELREHARERFHAQKEARVTTLDDLGTMLQDPKRNRDAIHALVDTRMDAMRTALHETVDEVIAFAQKLDDEQRTALAGALGELDRVEQRMNEREAARGQGE